MLWHYELENLEDLNESTELNEHTKSKYGQAREISVVLYQRGAKVQIIQSLCKG